MAKGVKRFRMSSTNRNAERQSNDYYITPICEIKKFWEEFKKRNNIEHIINVLDPSAGGDSQHPMSYPEVFKEYDFNLVTLDLRNDSLATIKGDYLTTELNQSFDMIITNPPFSYGIDFIKKALDDVADGGYVIMLLRLNFLGSKIRNEWLKENMPYEIYVHSKRMSFIDNGKTDSIEYAHFVWKKNYNKDTKLYLLEYD